MPRHLVALIAILLLAAGCETTPTATTSLSNATARYQAGDLDAARSIATPLVRHDGTESDEAAWIIGLCDYRQDRMTAARERFRYVTTGPNTSLAAQPPRPWSVFP